MNVLGFYDKFSDEDKCEDFIKKVIDGLYCPNCGSDKIYKTNRGYRCSPKGCGKKFTLLSQSNFNNSKLSYRQILFLIYIFAKNKTNISSVQLGIDLGVTQKSSWHASHRIREILGTEYKTKLRGVVEVDEVFLCGGTRWHRFGGYSKRKAPILGIIERGGNLRIFLIPNRKRDTLEKIIFENVEVGSTIYTDSFVSYNRLHEKFTHGSVNHSKNTYVEGDVHVNTIEGVWKILKTNIRANHYSVSEQYVRNYCNEIEYRYNHRDISFEKKFEDLIYRCFTYRRVSDCKGLIYNLGVKDTKILEHLKEAV